MILTNVLRILHTAAHLGSIIRSRERLLLANIWSTRMEELPSLAFELTAMRCPGAFTFGRYDSYSSMTELFRNLDTRQSLP